MVELGGILVVFGIKAFEVGRSESMVETEERDQSDGEEREVVKIHCRCEMS